jgi:microcin C transport system substrate-binding protein
MSPLNTRPSRRQILAGIASLPMAAAIDGPAIADEWANAAHGLSTFDELKYKVDFAHFDYVNKDAPKGGSFSQMAPTVLLNQSFQTFNSLNIFILTGDGAPGMELCFDSLMVRAFDEPDAVYGLVADRVIKDGNFARFRLRPEARFQDGSVLTAEDVAWSFATFINKGHPLLRQTLDAIKAVDAVSPQEIKVTLPEGHSRNLLLQFALMPILSKAYYQSRDFTAVTMEQPLGSGPYKVLRAIPGNSIEFDRDPMYWAKDLPVQKGHFNFDRVRFHQYADRPSALLAFKAREYEFREEFTSRAWATDYTFDAITSGEVRKEEIPDGTISGGQGWYLNLRRKKFQDIRIRQALQLAFDFEWSNKSLFYGSYTRSHSLFQGAAFMAKGPASAEEIALLEPFRDRLDPAVFTDPVLMQPSDGSGADRGQLARASALLKEAGCKREGAKLFLPDGPLFTFEVLDDDDTFSRVVAPFVENLKRLGIDASHRVVDGPQFQERQKRFDYDTVALRQSVSHTPGEELKAYFGSKSAKENGSRNLAGIADPVIDALLEKALAAQSRAELETALKALDRVARSLRYWIPHWSKGTHWLAYWDVYGRPATKPAFDRGVLLSWWHAGQPATKAQ